VHGLWISQEERVVHNFSTGYPQVAHKGETTDNQCRIDNAEVIHLSTAFIIISFYLLID
jgi:hypothetical protein